MMFLLSQFTSWHFRSTTTVLKKWNGRVAQVEGLHFAAFTFKSKRTLFLWGLSVWERTFKTNSYVFF
jgi:hypothetical protein